MKQFTAGKNEEGARLSRFVESVTQGLPRSLLYKSFRNKRVKVNGKRAEPDTRLREGDCVELYINDEFFKAVPAQSPPRRTQTPLQIVYEDADIAVLFKPAHLLCHSDRTGDESLVELFCAHVTETGEYDPAAEAAFRPALCNRLDRGTQGLVLGAKHYAALRDANEAIRAGLLQKEYLCITAGVPPEGIHTAYLHRDENTHKVTVRAQAAEGYKEIITGVTVLRRAEPFCLCRIALITGRTHQIRAHLAFLSAPILGDGKYGNRALNARTHTTTQALCAQSLTFGELPPNNTLHGLSGKRFEAPDDTLAKQFDALT